MNRPNGRFILPVASFRTRSSQFSPASATPQKPYNPRESFAAKKTSSKIGTGFTVEIPPFREAHPERISFFVVVDSTRTSPLQGSHPMHNPSQFRFAAHAIRVLRLRQLFQERPPRLRQSSRGVVRLSPAPPFPTIENLHRLARHDRRHRGGVG